LVHKHDNIVISRSLSKSYSLAGLRFGYAVARPEVIAEMMKVKDSYNCDAIAIVAATAAVQDREYAKMTWTHVRQERTPLTADLSRDTNETKIKLSLNLDGRGSADVRTGVGFFDHMLDLLAKHALIDLTINAAGDLHVDQHHTVEDVGLLLGQAIDKAVG